MHRIRSVSFGCLDGHWSYVATFCSSCLGQRMASNGHRSGRSNRFLREIPLGTKKRYIEVIKTTGGGMAQVVERRRTQDSITRGLNTAMQEHKKEL